MISLCSAAQYSGAGPVSLNAPTGSTSIQWFKDGVAVAGQTAAIFSAATAGTYYASYTDNVTSCTGDQTAQFVLLDSGNNITINGSTNNGTGSNYQWKNSGTSVAGETTANLTTSTGGLFSLDYTEGTCNISTTSHYVFILDASGVLCNAGSVAPILVKN